MNVYRDMQSMLHQEQRQHPPEAGARRLPLPLWVADEDPIELESHPSIEV